MENTREETGDTERKQVRQRSMARWQQTEGKPKRDRKKERNEGSNREKTEAIDGQCVAGSLHV